jgi:hypothetical protein
MYAGIGTARALEEAAVARAEGERKKLAMLKVKARMAHTMVPSVSQVIDTMGDAGAVAPSDLEQEAEMRQLHAKILKSQCPSVIYYVKPLYRGL